MGETPRHRGAWHAARGMIALTIAFALIVAPLVVSLTHSPTAYATVASITAEIAAHGHGHTHTHDDVEHDGHGGSFGGQTPADHDHPLHAVIYHPASASKPLPGIAHCILSDAFRQLTPDGPRRPPRAV